MEENKIEILAKSKKIFKDDNGNIIEERIISLPKHIKDVLEVFYHLSNFLPESKLSKKLKQLIILSIQYHDIGKVLPYFQRKIIKNESYHPFEIYTNIPHSLLSALMVNVDELKNTIAGIINDKENEETYTKYVLSAIAYHHWRENFYDIIEGYTDVFQNLSRLKSDTKKWEQIEKNIQQVYSELELPESFKPYINEKWLEGLNNGIQYSRYIISPYLLSQMPKQLQLPHVNNTSKDWVSISGFTMLSDHFASYVEGSGEKDITLAKLEIEGISFDEIKKKIENEIQAKIGSNYNSADIWQFNNVENYKDDNAILLASTGMGKTEFAYLWSNGEKFFYTLPLRTAVNQIYNRTASIFGKEKSGILHSDADVFIYGDGAETESMRVYEMAKQLSSPAIISTGDQFFPYALRPPSYERIFAKFSYSRLIIDEVQAYDPKAAAIVVKFIEHIVQMGGKFLLMTATLPGFIKTEIVERTGLKAEKILNLFEEDEQLGGFSKHKLELIIDSYRENQLSYSKEVLERIINKAKENKGSRVLVVINTVKQAQAVFDDLVKSKNKDVEIKLFHSRYTQKHRKETEDNLNDFIGNNEKSRNDKRAKILVATQVVEASLDLDADYLFTELSPWDSLIQRMGRALRELRSNTSNAAELIERRYNVPEIPTNVFVLIYEGKKNGKSIYESGQGYVYNNELLRATLKLIENKNISEGDLEKLNDNTKHDFKNLDKIQLSLSEKDKSDLVEKLFDGLPKQGSYLKNFYNMLQVLDSGFMSDRKSEAQRTFREINDVSVISEDKKEQFYEDLKSFKFSKKYAYTAFKSEIISKYIISVQRNKVKEYLYETNLVSYRIKLEEIFPEKQKLSKFENWLYGVYFVPLEYSEDNGLIGVREFNSFEAF
jgi:CRISPR-associated endonuclease/helicase Cas3